MIENCYHHYHDVDYYWPMCNYNDGTILHAECFFIRDSVCVFNHPVTVGPYQTDNLLDILNNWVQIQDNRSSYSTWGYEDSRDYLSFCNMFSTEEIDDSFYVKIYPNPTSNSLVIRGNKVEKNYAVQYAGAICNFNG